MSIKISTLQTFVAVAECGKLTDAAERLHRTPLDDALSAARSAQSSWARTGLGARLAFLAGKQLSREEETAIRQLLAPEALTGSCTGLPAGFVIQKPSVFRTRQRD